MRYFAPLIGLLLISAAAVFEPASAQPNRAREGVQSGEVRSLDQILNGIRRERPGSLADVEGPNVGPYGEPHYRLKWLTPDGRVLWLDTDARTGRVLGVQGDDRGPGPGAAPPRQQDPRAARDPRAAQGLRRNLNPPPADQYDFGAPTLRPPRSGTPSRRPSPEQGFAPGRQPDFYRPPPEFRRGAPPPPDYRRGPPPPQGFDRGPPPPQGFDRGPPPPPQGFDRGPPPQQRFDRGPERNRSGLERGAPNPPRGGFRSGSSFGGSGAGPRMPQGQPRGPRSYR
jgi:hypothetical protein